jgi:hypothetical protein
MKIGSRKIKSLVFIIAVLSGILLYAAFRKDVAEIQAPFYLKRKAAGHWLTKSRIVGIVENPPEAFDIKVFKVGAGSPIFSKGFSGAFNVYETDFLPLGNYTLKVGGLGYNTKTYSKPIKLKNRSDCVVNIVFE